MFTFISFLLINLLSTGWTQDIDIKKAMETHKIVPDLIAAAPQQSLKIIYDNEIVANDGVELKPIQVKDQPTVSWESEVDTLYTIVMLSPDSPSRKKPIMKDLLHWMVGNIPGNDVLKGDVIVEYVGAGPPEGSGLHRYVILVFGQPAKITFDEVLISKTSHEGRFYFSTQKFIQKYNLGSPIAGNFFQASYDDYTKILHKQVGVKFD